MDAIYTFLANRKFPSSSSWFSEHFIKPTGVMIDSEGECWDFKEDWPFSYSDSYFMHLTKLVLAFANTAGGLIIFGVQDKYRTPKKRSVRPNMDKFTSAIANIVDNPPSIELIQIQLDNGIEIDVVVVYPNKKVVIPSSFKRSYAEKSEIERFWVRVGHETTAARSKHIPILFCGASRVHQKNELIESSLPPNPATIRQFIGRMDPFAKVFGWLGDQNEPRIFLYGRGGSGKTTIAYEIAKCISSYGRNISIGGGIFDFVIFVSAKEIELSTSDSTIREFIGRDFEDAKSLVVSILFLGAWKDFDVLSEMNLSDLYIDLEEFFNTVSAFIVIDDIDTLTTKGIDAGFDQIFRALIRARRTTKVLYTQRNAPTQSLANSIEVPGLSEAREYPRFVEVCCEQFSVELPPDELMFGTLAHVTERRPLVVESIIALRRSAGSYQRAITLFEENVGTDAKTYVFEREWNALTSNYSRHLLCALALVDKPLFFDDIETILRYEDSRIVESINETREMFLDLYEKGSQTTYAMGSLTRSFVLVKSRDLDRFASIDARVKSFKRSFFPELPELSRLISACDNLIRSSQRLNDMTFLEQAWEKLWDNALPAKITEDPRFRAFRGYVGTRFTPAKIQAVRDDFEYAFSMKFDPPEAHIRAWYIAEEQAGEMMVQGLRICNFVEAGRSYANAIKLEFLSRKASLYYYRGRGDRYDSVEASKGNLVESLTIHANVYYRSVNSGDINVYKYEEYFRNTALFLFHICELHDDADGMIDTLIECAKGENVYLDPFLPALKEYFVRAMQKALRERAKERTKGRLQHLSRILLSEEKWEERATIEEVAILLRDLQ